MSEHTDSPVIVQDTGIDVFEAHYAGRPGAGWEIGRPQPRFVDLVAQGRIAGPVLDVGCGSGDNTLMVAAAGIEALGVDLAPTGIDLARHKAEAAGVQVEFEVADALDLKSLGRTFRTVIDVGLLHCFAPEDRHHVVRSLREVLVVGGSYFVLGWSDLQPGDWGPRRLSPDGIRSDFAHGWRVRALERTTFDVAFGNGKVQAIYAEIERV